MGNCLSGWYGRRSSRPYFDELPRLAVSEVKPFSPGLLAISTGGQSYRLKAIRIPIGCMTVPRFVCPACHRAVKVVYIGFRACCYRCTGARYRTQSESPSRRAVRRAERIFRRCKVESGRKEGKPKWQRWPTYERLSAEAERVFPIIEADECAPYDVLQRVMDMKPLRRGRPRKVTR